MEYEPIRTFFEDFEPLFGSKDGWDPDLDQSDKQDPDPHQGDADPQPCSKSKLQSPFLHLLLAFALQL